MRFFLQRCYKICLVENFKILFYLSPFLLNVNFAIHFAEHISACSKLNKYLYVYIHNIDIHIH